jgi:hypothetical protein
MVEEPKYNPSKNAVIFKVADELNEEESIPNKKNPNEVKELLVIELPLAELVFALL